MIPKNIRNVISTGSFVLDGSYFDYEDISFYDKRTANIFIPNNCPIMDDIFIVYGAFVFNDKIIGRSAWVDSYYEEHEKIAELLKGVSFEKYDVIQRDKRPYYASLFYFYFFKKEMFQKIMPKTFEFYKGIINSYGLY